MWYIAFPPDLPLFVATVRELRILLDRACRFRCLRLVRREQSSGRRFLAHEGGATAIEHALLACIVALVIVFAAARGLSPATVFERIVDMVERSSNEDSGRQD